MQYENFKKSLILFNTNFAVGIFAAVSQKIAFSYRPQLFNHKAAAEMRIRTSGFLQFLNSHFCTNFEFEMCTIIQLDYNNNTTTE